MVVEKKTQQFDAIGSQILRFFIIQSHSNHCAIHLHNLRYLENLRNWILCFSPKFQGVKYSLFDSSLKSGGRTCQIQGYRYFHVVPCLQKPYNWGPANVSRFKFVWLICDETQIWYKVVWSKLRKAKIEGHLIIGNFITSTARCNEIGFERFLLYSYINVSNMYIPSTRL